MSASPPGDITPLRQLYRYWNAKRRERLMPLRSEIDLLSLPGLLPKLMMIEGVESEAGIRFRYTMLGTELVGRFGRDPTGRFVDEVLEGEHRTFMVDFYTEAWRTMQPAMAASEYLSANEVAFTCQRLLLPLAGNGGGRLVSSLLGLQVFLPGSPNLTKLEFRDHSIRNVRLKAA